MVELIKTCDQYSSRFNFGHFFPLHNPVSFAGEKYILRKRFSEGMGNLVLFLGNDKNLGESFVWGH